MTTSIEDENAKLAPLHFLEGDWQGEGHGPYGPYKLDAHVERRGRWLLMTSTIYDDKSEEVTYVSTQIYGYDDNGPRLYFFDTAGSFKFSGRKIDDELRFDWREGDNWKRSQYWPEADGTVRFRYESVFPKKSTEVFEGRWLPRRSSGAEDGSNATRPGLSH